VRTDTAQGGTKCRIHEIYIDPADNMLHISSLPGLSQQQWLFTRDDLLERRVQFRKLKQSPSITSNSVITIEVDESRAQTFLNWAGLGVVHVFTSINVTNGVYSLVLPTGREGLQPNVTFLNNQIGIKVFLRSGTHTTYLIDRDGIIHLTAPAKLLAALRDGSLLKTRQ